MGAAKWRGEEGIGMPVELARGLGSVVRCPLVDGWGRPVSASPRRHSVGGQRIPVGAHPKRGVRCVGRSGRRTARGHRRCAGPEPRALSLRPEKSHSLWNSGRNRTIREASRFVDTGGSGIRIETAFLPKPRILSSRAGVCWVAHSAHRTVSFCLVRLGRKTPSSN